MGIGGITIEVGESKSLYEVFLVDAPVVVAEVGERVLGSVIVSRSVPLLVRLRLPIGVGLVDGVA